MLPPAGALTYVWCEMLLSDPGLLRGLLDEMQRRRESLLI